MNTAGTRRFAWVSTLGVVAMALTACQPTIVRPPAAALAPIAPLDTTGASQYAVDGAASQVRILVYRAGTLARLGHNHVISSKDVRGVVYWHREPSRTRMELTLPVETLIVDDPQVRAAEGPEFSATAPADAREGTYRNLVGAEVLDVERFPIIKLQSVSLSGTNEQLSVVVRITIKDVARDVVVRVQVEEKASRLTAQGEFDVKQTEFGIVPFSAAAGALRVQDRITIKFKVSAVRVQAS